MIARLDHFTLLVWMAALLMGVDCWAAVFRIVWWMWG